MIKEFKNGYEFMEFMNDGSGKNLPCYLEDGVYFSTVKPEIKDFSEKFELDLEKDFITCPYQTDTAIIWRGEKPTVVENVEGQGNYGSSLSIFVGKPGFVTVCYEND